MAVFARIRTSEDLLIDMSGKPVGERFLVIRQLNNDRKWTGILVWDLQESAIYGPFRCPVDDFQDSVSYGRPYEITEYRWVDSSKELFMYCEQGHDLCISGLAEGKDVAFKWV